MKPFKITAVLILFLLLMQGILLPRITSRVEGTVVDEETGNPIVGASVGLFRCTIWGPALSYTLTAGGYIETDNKGFFRFDDVYKGELFIVVFKEGYAAVGPFFYQKPGLFEDNSGSAPTSEIERFILEEGQIKHLKIRMEKEAILKVSVHRKTFAGIEPIDTFKISILHPGFVDRFEEEIDLGRARMIDKAVLEKEDKIFKKKYTLTEDGLKTTYFKKGTVSLTIQPNGCPPKAFMDIQLEKGQTKLFEYVVDFTKTPVIYGTIINKETGKPFHAVDLYLEKKDEPNKYFYLRSYTLDGKYWFTGMPQGAYLLNIYSFGGKREFDIKMVINVAQNSTIEINKEI